MQWQQDEVIVWRLSVSWACAVKVRGYCRVLSNWITPETQMECVISAAQGQGKTPPRTSEVSHIWVPGGTNGSRFRRRRRPTAQARSCTDLRTCLLGTAERKSGVNFLSFRDILRARLGISINLHIYPKFSKFTMTNVTVPLNWSSSLGSLEGLEKMPATRTWKEINL